MISYTTGEPLGNLEAGLAASLTGSVPIAIVSGGVLCLVGAAAVVAALPALWRYDSRARAEAARPGPCFRDRGELTAIIAEDSPRSWIQGH